jgi:hypothetical protein
LGRRQVVRQGILIPPCGGSNPPAPARQSRGRTCHPSKGRKACCRRPFAIRRQSLNSQIGKLACHFGKSLRPNPRKLPFSGDSDRRLGSIATAARPPETFLATGRASLIRRIGMDCRAFSSVRIWHPVGMPDSSSTTSENRPYPQQQCHPIYAL